MSEGLGETNKGRPAAAESKDVAGSEDTDLLGGLLDEMHEPHTTEADHAADADTDGMQHLLDEIDLLDSAENTAAVGAESAKSADAQIGNGLYLLSALAVAILMVVLAYFNAPATHHSQHAMKQVNAATAAPGSGAEVAATVAVEQETAATAAVETDVVSPEAAQTSIEPAAAGSDAVTAAAEPIDAVENGPAMEQQTIAPQEATAASPAGSAVAEVDVAAPVLANQVEQVIEAAVEHAVVKAEGESALEQAHANTLAQHEAVTASQSLDGNHTVPVTADMPAGETHSVPVWSGWAINLVSYADRVDAEAEQQKLLARNVHAAILEVQLASGTFYRVRITGFATKKSAMQVQALFKQENEYRDSWVNHYGQ